MAKRPKFRTKLDKELVQAVAVETTQQATTIAQQAEEKASPVGSINIFTGDTIPSGWLLCDGSQISRSTYSALFAVIGTAFGYGDNSTTFNIPDLRGKFPRGKVNFTTVSGSGTVSSNNATFTNHRVNRTGFRIRLQSGTLTGLSLNTDYFGIVIDDNTLAFATSLANAIAGVKVSISGANSAVIVQWEDPDASSRVSDTKGGASGNFLGASQSDIFGSHNHIEGFAGVNSTASYGVTTAPSGNINTQSGTSTSNHPLTSSSGGNETRPRNILVNYIIKF